MKAELSLKYLKNLRNFSYLFVEVDIFQDFESLVVVSKQ